MMNKLKIKDLAKQIRGVSYKTSDLHEELDSQSVILLRANNISNGLINFDDVIYVDKQKVSEIQYLKKGDILICASSGSKKLVGKAASVDFDMECTFGAFCKVVRPKEEYMDYLGSYFQSSIYRNKISKASLGANINNIRNEHIDGLEVPLYSKENMSTITKRMQLLQKIIININQELKLLDELVKARFVELFGTLDNPTFNYNKSTLGELCYKITDGKHGGCSLIQGSNRYFVGAREIYDDKVHYENAPEISVDDFEKDYRRCNVEVGDFLIVNTGATIGKSAIATDKRTKHTLLQKSVALLKLNQDLLNPEFLKWCYRINTRMYLVESSSAQPNLLLSKIKATEIYVPPIELQNQFADFVKEVDKSRFIIKSMIKEGLL